MNPYEVLDLPRNFTLQQLKDNYKRIALKVHPDKGGSEQLFLLVTKCFKKLLQEYHRRQADKQFYELKTEFNRATDQHMQRPPSTDSMGSSRKLNLEKFNQVFAENRLQDTYDKGYEKWMNDAAPPPEDTVRRRTFGEHGASNKTRFSHKAFNTAFDKEARIDHTNKYIVKYKEPEALVGAKKIAFTELGEDHVDDFSGDNMTKQNLHFMDYKVAHTTSKIVDPRIINQIKTYKSIHELEAERGCISHDMDDITREEVEYRQKLEAVREEKRREVLREKDRLSQQQYEKLNRLMLGHQ